VVYKYIFQIGLGFKFFNFLSVKIMYCACMYVHVTHYLTLHKERNLKKGNENMSLIEIAQSRFDPQQRRKDFFCNLGAHPASCTLGTVGCFPGTKARPGHDADHSPLSSAEVEIE
jgi:hypothetical protein